MNVGVVKVVERAVLRDTVVKWHNGRSALDEAGAGLRVLNKLELSVRDTDGLSHPHRIDVRLLQDDDELTVGYESCRHITL